MSNNNTTGPGYQAFFRDGIAGTPTESFMSVHAALTFGRVYRSVEPDTIVLANGMKLHQDEAIRQGIIDHEAAAIIAVQGGTNVASPFTRDDPVSEADVKAQEVATASGTPEGALLAAVKALISGPAGPDADLAFMEAMRTVIAPKSKK